MLEEINDFGADALRWLKLSNVLLVLLLPNSHAASYGTYALDKLVFGFQVPVIGFECWRRSKVLEQVKVSF